MTNEGLIILGMHRSGTSCLAGMLQSAGFYSGMVEEWSPDNNKGNRENTAIVHLNDALLKDAGGSWKQPVFSLSPTEKQLIARDDLVQSLGSANQPWMFKDPRTLLTLSFWLDAIPDARMLGIFRHPVAVANSLAVRNSMPLKEGLSLWITYNKALLDAVEKKGIPLLHFSEDLTGFTQAAMQVIEEEFPASGNSGTLQLSRMGGFVADELVHQVQSPDIDISSSLRNAEISDPESEQAASLWRSLIYHARNMPSGVVCTSNQITFPTDKITELLSQNRFDEALESILASKPKRTDLWQHGLEAIRRAGSAEILARWIDRGLGSIPDNPAFMFEKAKLTWLSGNEEEAIRILEKTSALAPGWTPALNLLSKWYYAKEDWQQAAKTLNELSSHSQLEPAALYFAQIFIDSGQGFSEEESIRIPVVLNNINQELSFELSNYKTIEKIRFDPLNDYAVVKIDDIQIFDTVEIQQKVRLVSNTAQAVADGIYFFSDRDPQVQLAPPQEKQQLARLVVNLQYLHTGTSALLQCYNKIKQQFESYTGPTTDQALDADDNSFSIPTTETEWFMSGWKLEKTDDSGSDKNKVVLSGWAIPKSGKSLNVVLRYDGLTRSYALNVDRPDVIKRVTSKGATTAPHTKCGFRYSVPKAALVEIGVEYDMRLYWIETVQT